MIPIRDIRLSVGTLVAANAAGLAPAVNANEIALIKANFNPDENLVIGDLVLADFDGSTPKVGSTGAQQTGIDPLTGDQLITITEPAGGWRWITTGITNLPQTIFGFALTTTGQGALLATQLLPTPIVLQAVGQQINLGSCTLTVVLEPLS